MLIYEKIYNSYLFFGIDGLDFNLKDLKKDCKFYNDIEKNIDFDNSSFGYIDLMGLKFMYQKINVNGYNTGFEFLISIDDKVIPFFSLFPGKEIKIGKSKDKVSFYSSSFVLEYLNKLNFKLKDFIKKYFSNISLYRLDIALDLPLTIKELQGTIFNGVKFHTEIGEDKKHPEFHQTYYIKNPKSSNNRKYIIRIYDKVLDTFKKKKNFLFPHLEKSSNVRRIELELRPIECKRLEIGIIDILENKNNVLSKIFFYYLNKNVNEKYIIENINLALKKYINEKKDLRKIYLKTKHIPKDYVSRVNGYLQNIFINTGFDGLFEIIYNLQYIESFDIKNKKLVLNTQPNYNFIISFFENNLNFLLKNKILTERKIFSILRKKLKSKIIIKLNNNF